MRFLVGFLVGLLVMAACVGTFDGPRCATANAGLRGFAVVCR